MSLQDRWIDTAHGPLSWATRTLVMGIVNVTPDSFSDGGCHNTTETAVGFGMTLSGEGADVLDVGGESTRPGAVDIDPEEQIRRVVPVIAGLRRAGFARPISVDTRSAAVAEAAIDVGADLVNDVSAARHDSGMAVVVSRRSAAFVVMHMQGTPATMQIAPVYENVVGEVETFFEERVSALARAGVDPQRIFVDPGIGFGKTLEHNLALLRASSRYAKRWPLMVGPSRKRFIGELLRIEAPAERDEATAVVAAWCAMQGAAMVRVHDVRRARRAVELACHLQPMTNRSS